MSSSRRPPASLDLATFFDVSLDLLCIRDSEYRFVRVNPAWETALGYLIEEMEGRPMLDFIHPDDALPSRERMQDVEVQNIMGFINRYRHKDGGYRHLEWRARRVGEFVFGVARDVTERLALEAEMAAARTAAEAANRAKSEFLANMSHEIRTPMNAILGYADIVEARDADPGERAEAVRAIRRSGQHLLTIINDILDLSKIEAGKMPVYLEEVSLRHVLAELSEAVEPLIREKVLRFEFDVDADIPSMFTDRTKLKQILLNLLSNAIKFTSRGSVRLAAGLASPHRIWISVTDTGIGIAPEELSDQPLGVVERTSGAGVLGGGWSVAGVLQLQLLMRASMQQLLLCLPLHLSGLTGDGIGCRASLHRDQRFAHANSRFVLATRL